MGKKHQFNPFKSISTYFFVKSHYGIIIFRTAINKEVRRNSVRNLMCVGRYAEMMELSEAKRNHFEMPSSRCQYCAFQRNATTSNCPLNTKSHPAGMRICYSIFAGISLRLCYISLRSFRITFAAYLPTHIKSLRDFFLSLGIYYSSLITYQKWL